MHPLGEHAFLGKVFGLQKFVPLSSKVQLQQTLMTFKILSLTDSVL